MKTFYITTPIYYATDKPHLGHAYTTVAADVFARYWRARLGPDNVFFSVGTDEHGQKIFEAAQRAGQDPKAFVDGLVPRYEEAWRALNIDATAFVRTTDHEHIKYAQQFLSELHAKGFIYKGEYEGLYCVGCEAYKTETELVDGKCPDHPNLTPEQRREENYFFKLTEFAPKILAKITSGELHVLPEKRRNEVIERLKAAKDISISRPNLSWGVPVPWDESHTVYVWVEALLNYRSVLQINQVPSFWPPQIQLMGKEILWFHAGIWPALLLANDEPLPNTIFAHGWFTIDGQKMSKTLGNIIDPLDLVAEWGTDATRYLLLATATFGEDGDLQVGRFADLYTSDLANDLGNLLQRVVTLIGRAKITIARGAKPSCADVDQAIEDLRLDEGLKAIWLIVRDANKRLEQAKPWEMLTNHQSPIINHQLVSVLTTAYRQLETIAAGLAPYLPTTSERIFEQLRTSRPAPLFPRRDQS